MPSNTPFIVSTGEVESLSWNTVGQSFLLFVHHHFNISNLKKEEDIKYHPLRLLHAAPSGWPFLCGFHFWPLPLGLPKTGNINCFGPGFGCLFAKKLFLSGETLINFVNGEWGQIVPFWWSSLQQSTLAVPKAKLQTWMILSQIQICYLCFLMLMQD